MIDNFFLVFYFLIYFKQLKISTFNFTFFSLFCVCVCVWRGGVGRVAAGGGVEGLDGCGCVCVCVFAWREDFCNFAVGTD